MIVKMLNIRHMGPLSNALNKAGICQKIDFKRSDGLECSMRHTNHNSIFGMTTTDIVQSLYPIRVAMHQRSKTACRNSARLVGWLTLASMVRVTSDHMFSIRFISGDTAGHFMKLTTVQVL